MSDRGFTLVETLISVGLLVAVTAAVFTLVAPAQGTFQAQPEIADMEQRLRVAVDALTKDLLMASAVLPYRAGPVSPDPPGSFFDDRITIILATPLDAEPTSRTYYLRRGDATLMEYDGDRTDSPVVDHVSGLTFEHIGYPDTRLVHVTLRVSAAGAGTSRIPDREIRFDVAPRNIAAVP